MASRISSARSREIPRIESALSELLLDRPQLLTARNAPSLSSPSATSRSLTIAYRPSSCWASVYEHSKLAGRALRGSETKCSRHTKKRLRLRFEEDLKSTAAIVVGYFSENGVNGEMPASVRREDAQTDVFG